MNSRSFQPLCDHPAEIFKRLNTKAGQKDDIMLEKLQIWIQHADRYHAQFNTFDDAAVVKLLVNSVGGEKELVKALYSLKDTPMQDRARTLQRVLAEKLSLEQMIPLWPLK